MTTETKKESFWFLSLPAHMAWLVLHEDISIVPMGTIFEKTPNRFIIHVSRPEDAAEQEEIDKFFRDIGKSSDLAPSNTLIGWIETRSAVNYDTEEKWAKDSNKHGYEGTLSLLKQFNGWQYVFGQRLAKPRLLDDYVYDVPAPEGMEGQSLWNAPNPFYEMAGSMAIRSEAILTETLLPPESSTS